MNYTRISIIPIRDSILTNFVQGSMRHAILRRRISFPQRSHAQSPLIREAPRFEVAECDGDGLNDCAVCLSEIKEKEKIAILPCRHVFHHACLLPWFQEHRSCPTCRAES